MVLDFHLDVLGRHETLSKFQDLSCEEPQIAMNCEWTKLELLDAWSVLDICLERLTEKVNKSRLLLRIERDNIFASCSHFPVHRHMQ